ncbi:MAG: DNA gyrase/topoisomerase IV subunit A [Christensenellales bacterium]|jgi:DNA gyrase subunit A
MPRKHDTPPAQPETIQSSLSEVMHNSMLPYAEYVIMERALPRVEDGLKPVQRRILYTMMELGLAPDRPYRKCARIVGDCLGKYHPHGDTSVYDALVRMAQPFSMRGTLVDGHGNFGSIDGDSAAAMRYTEARMAPLALEMLRDIQKDTVPFRLNFDDTLNEPDLLPARFPNLLVNGSYGIAVGLATNIPPHNLRETINAVIHVIDHPSAGVDELMRFLPAPDFPTGGVLLDNDEIRTAYATGRGRLTLRAKVHVEQGRAGRQLLCITEVPYQVNKAQMLEKILKLSEEKKAALGCIYDIRDESDRTGLRAVIELKKEAEPEKVLAYLYKYSDLQVTFGVNLVAIAQGKPMQLTLPEAIRHYISHQRDIITRRTRYDLDQAKARAHILEGLIKAVDNLDEVLAIIRASKNGKEAKERLIARFAFTDIQAQAILDMRLQRLTGLEILALRKEYEEIQKLIAKLESILKSDRKLMVVIKEELQEIADKYGDDRRTMLLDERKAIAASDIVEEQVPEDAIVVFTRGGLLRRYHPRTYERLELPAEEAEMPRYTFRTQTDRTLMFFTNNGNCYTLQVSQLEELSRPKDRGISLSGVLMGLEENEQCVALFDCAMDELPLLPDFLFFTEQGTVKRSAAADYQVRRSKFVALSLADSDRLLAVCHAEGARDCCCLTRGGMIIRFSADDVPVMGRTAKGVRGIRLNKGDALGWACMLSNSDQLVLFSERGYAKRVPGSSVDIQNRGGKGVKSFYFNKSGNNGSYIGAMACLTDARSFSVLQAQGEMTAFSSDEIICQALADRGKPYLMALMDNTVTDIAL